MTTLERAADGLDADGLEQLRDVLTDVADERLRQHVRWGQQDHAHGTGGAGNRQSADDARAVCQQAFGHNLGTWRHVLDEEVREAFAEADPARLRVELVQVAAVAVAWVEAIDRAALGRRP